MHQLIDRRKTYGIMIDTETANTLTDENGKLDTNYVLPYDIGFAVIDSKGKVYETYSFVVTDIYDYEKDLMQSAYYANKLPQYEIDLANGNRERMTAYQVQKKIRDICDLYLCKFVVGHNMLFDLKSCNNLVRWTTKSKYRYFFPYGIEIWDTLKMARQVIAPKQSYIDFCNENRLLTQKQGKPSLTAESLYKFIVRDPNFVESHTALEDVLIQCEIYKYCVNQHKAMNKNLFKKN